MFCTSRDSWLYLVFQNGVCAFLAGVLATVLVLTLAEMACDDWRAWRARRRGR